MFTAATFIGYLVAGVPGAVLATVGIFLPSFLFVALLNPLVTKIRESTLLGAILDGLNVGALGMMAGVKIYLVGIRLLTMSPFRSPLSLPRSFSFGALITCG